MNQVVTTCNGFIYLNVETVILSTRQMDQIFGSVSAPSVKGVNRKLHYEVGLEFTKQINLTSHFP